MNNVELDNLIEKKFRNVSLETKIISYILQKDCKIALLLERETFTIEAHQVLLEISKKTKMEYPKQVLWQTVKLEISEDDFDIYKSFVKKVYNSDLANITTKNVEKLCNKLLSLQQSRKFMNAISDTISDVNKFDLEDARFKFRNILLTSDIKVRASINYVKDFEKRRDHLKEVAKNPKKLAGVPTGIKEFDKISGGLMRTEFGVLVAGTGVGKSLTLGNLATNAWYKGYNVFIATLEMTNRQYAYRLDSRNARVDFSKFRRAELNVFDYEQWEKKISRYRKRKENFIRISHFQRGSTVSDIENEAYRIQDREKQEIDLLIIDYINLLSVDSKFGGSKDWKNQTDSAWEMKELSQTFNDGLGLPIWSANQLTDEGQKAKRITTSHMKYARGISEVAPVIISIGQSEEAKIGQYLEMNVIKCRDFAKQDKPILLYPNFQYMQIDDPSKHLDV